MAEVAFMKVGDTPIEIGERGIRTQAQRVVQVFECALIVALIEKRSTAVAVVASRVGPVTPLQQPCARCNGFIFIGVRSGALFRVRGGMLVCD